MLFPAALCPCSFSLFLTLCVNITAFLLPEMLTAVALPPSREPSRAAFILLPQPAWGPTETPPWYDCFHTFKCFKEYQLRTAYWSRVGNPPLQSNLQPLKECRGILLYILLPPPPPCPICMLTPSKPGPPLLVPPFLRMSDEADSSDSQTLIVWTIWTFQFYTRSLSTLEILFF